MPARASVCDELVVASDFPLPEGGGVSRRTPGAVSEAVPSWRIEVHFDTSPRQGGPDIRRRTLHGRVQ